MWSATRATVSARWTRSPKSSVKWERQSIADAAQRPPRKYYKLTQSGELTLETSRRRYPLLAKLVPAVEVQKV